MPRPGEKKDKFTLNGVYSNSRRAWFDVDRKRFTLYVGFAGDGPEESERFMTGHPILITISPLGSRTATRINLGSMTVDELYAFKEFIDIAIAETIPVAEMRDLEAEEAYKNGDTSYARIYRDLPRVIVREGPELGNGESLRRRPEWPRKMASFIEQFKTTIRGRSTYVPKQVP